MIWEVLKRRWWVLVLVPALAVLTTVMLTSRITPTYEATSVLMVDYRRPVQGDASGEVVPAGQQSNYLNTLVGVIMSRPVALQVVESLDLASSNYWTKGYAEMLAARGTGSDVGGAPAFEDWAANRLLELVRARPGNKNNFIAITFVSVDPQFAAAAANAFADAFRQTTRDFETNPAMESIESSGELVAELRTELENAQRRLSEYQQQTGIVTTDERLDVETTRLNELAQQRLEAEVAAKTAKGRLDAVVARASSGLEEVDTSTVVESSRLQALQRELTARQGELAELSTTLGGNHPSLRQAAAQVASLNRELRSATNDAVETLRLEANQAAALAEAAREAEAAQRSSILEFRSSRDGMQALLREVESARTNYDRALDLLSQYSIYANLNQTNVAILNEARPPAAPADPNVKVNLVLALLIGGILGAALMVLWELLDGGVRSRKHIEETGELDVIGEVPNAGRSA
jgi:polysaccharide biosynthesis transport protein